jgi:hypothetical protein
MGDRERLLAAIDGAFERLTARVLLAAKDDATHLLALETLQQLRQQIDADPAWAARLFESPDPAPADRPAA